MRAGLTLRAGLGALLALGTFAAVAPAGVAAAVAAAVAPAAAGGEGTLWPANPDWQQYVQAPATRTVRPARVVSTSGDVTGAANLLTSGSGTTTMTMTAGGPAPVIILDFGKEVGGLPRYDVAAASGDPVFQAGYSEALEYLSPTGDLGNSGPTESGDPHRYDSYTVTGPGPLTSTSVQGGERYAELTLQSPGTVTLSGASITFEPFLGTPGTFKGYFVSSSPLLNRLWYDGAYTVSLDQLRPDTPDAGGTNPLPVVLDGAKRDRAVWEGDLSVAGPTLYYSSDAARYMKDSLRLLGSYQLSSGFVEGEQRPSAAVHTGGLIPGTVGNYSASYSMYWVVNLATYYQFTGDRAFVKSEWPAVRRELAWNAAQVNDQGLFITDASDGASWHQADLTGAQTYYNALYYRTLRDAATLAGAVGDSAAAAGYDAQAAAVKAAVNQYLFDPATGVYDISTTQTGYVAQDANAYAMLYGIATPARAARISKVMRAMLTTTHGPTDVSLPAPAGYGQEISPFMGSYELWALLAGGDTSAALSLMRTEWGPMTRSGTGDTFWETMAIDGSAGGSTSLAHGWSTGPTSALSGYVLGAAPVRAGYATWLVDPHTGGLTWAEGQAATPHGPLAVKWGRDAARGLFDMDVTAPAGTSGTVAVPAFGRRVSVWVNGHLAWNGQQGLAFGAHLRGGSVYLSGLAGGTYEIDSRGQAAGPAAARPSLTVSASPSLPRPGQPTTVTATVTNPGRACLSGVTVELQPPPAPAGWTVTPNGPVISGGTVDIGTVGAGSSASATFTVTLPSTGLSGSTQEMLATATYTGCAAGSVAQSLYGRASVQVLYPSLSAAFDNTAVSDDSDTSTASVDGNGDSFSAQALAALGVTPGASLSYDGIGFTWPSAAAGQPDNTVAAGQTFALSGRGTSLGLLDTGTFGPVDGTGTINYADGTTQSFTISVPDWYRTAPAGSNPVIVLPYRNTPPGHHGGNATGQDYTPNNIYEQTIPLRAGQPVTSVTLPATSSDSAGSPSLHVFAIGIGG